eukprot:430223_1
MRRLKETQTVTINTKPNKCVTDKQRTHTIDIKVEEHEQKRTSTNMNNDDEDKLNTNIEEQKSRKKRIEIYGYEAVNVDEEHEINDVQHTNTTHIKTEEQQKRLELEVNERFVIVDGNLFHNKSLQGDLSFTHKEYNELFKQKTLQYHQINTSNYHSEPSDEEKKSQIHRDAEENMKLEIKMKSTNQNQYIYQGIHEIDQEEELLYRVRDNAEESEWDKAKG